MHTQNYGTLKLKIPKNRLHVRTLCKNMRREKRRVGKETKERGNEKKEKYEKTKNCFKKIKINVVEEKQNQNNVLVLAKL